MRTKRSLCLSLDRHLLPSYWQPSKPCMKLSCRATMQYGTRELGSAFLFSRFLFPSHFLDLVHTLIKHSTSRPICLHTVTRMRSLLSNSSFLILEAQKLFLVYLIREVHLPLCRIRSRAPPIDYYAILSGYQTSCFRRGHGLQNRFSPPFGLDYSILYVSDLLSL